LVTPLRFDHITAVVADADAAADAMQRLLGAPSIASVTLPGMAIRSFALADGEIHLTAPTGPGPVEEHYRAHGAGFHHIALRVAHLDATLSALASRGFKPMGDPIETAPGLREVFLDPATAGGLLIQLVERRHHTNPQDLDPTSIRSLAIQSQRSR
jgi:catechol 2,3-dioxygenase-like lactoylglutathione lyase family enzyme